jgi:hypothetical protein
LVPDGYREKYFPGPIVGAGLPGLAVAFSAVATPEEDRLSLPAQRQRMSGRRDCRTIAIYEYTLLFTDHAMEAWYHPSIA